MQLSKNRGNTLFILLIVFVFYLTVFTPVHAEPLILREHNNVVFEVKQAEKLLINGSGFFLTTGDSRELYQGYTITVKSVNQDQKQAWLSLKHEEEVLKDEILSESDVLNYTKEDGSRILNITVDTIYISPEGELVTFTVDQYQDYDLPDPVIEEETEDETAENETEVVNTDDPRQTGGFTALHAFACTSIILAGRRVFSK